MSLVQDILHIHAPAARHGRLVLQRSKRPGRSCRDHQSAGTLLYLDLTDAGCSSDQDESSVDRLAEEQRTRHTYHSRLQIST